MLVRLWFAVLVPVVLVAVGISYLITRNGRVAVGGGLVFFAVVVAGWVIAARS